ncbi:MAG: potassium transporter TrkA [Chloroflexi bacterium]|nr:potassium transporter TrkA [Chloroflexota bacterium]
MTEPTFFDKLRYRFDNFMSKGTIALIGGLGVIALVIILLASTIITIGRIRQEGAEEINFGEAAWESLMRTLDAGTMGGDTGAGFRVIMLAVTFGGIFIVSALIGVINNGIEGKIEEMRKGRSRVIERGHTVVLGWSNQIFPIISELVLANANQKNPRIVILGDKDKVEMEDEIRDRVGDTKNTAVVCRTGSPIDPGDLDMVSVQTSRSIVILAPDDDDDPDSNVIKTMLAITNGPNRRKEPYHIVAEIRDSRNMEVARMVGRDEAELVLVGDLISRITVQTCRQSGLSVVYTELLDFGGDEIYFKHEAGLAGKTFGEALLAYEDSTVIGLRQAKEGVRLNPPMDTRIGPDDKIIAISQDDDTIRLSGLADLKINEKAIHGDAAPDQRPERTLILGWNWRLPTIVRELDHYVSPGSVVTIAANKADGEEQIKEECAGVKNQAIEFREADTTHRRVLDELNLSSYDHVIILCSDELDQQRADAHTLITLLHLRDIADKSGADVSVVSEMLDIRNRNLAEVTRADDFIVSEKLISLMLSQVSENKELNAVFADLFDPEGSEVYLKPASTYVDLGQPINFYTVIEAARRRGGVAIGYRLKSLENDADKAYGVKVNPKKSETVAFSEGDRIIVIAES